ncbi:MAG: hypothetical protein M3N32_05770 [Actinomycetota bacterium]|nr:hypothetical protein [Actinomycetota bacterium]
MATFVVGTAACGVGAESSPTRSVLADYNHDEFASAFLAYFPKDVQVHAGDTVVFRQEWTGEPHSVTMGTLVDRMMGVVAPLLEKYSDPHAQMSPEDEASFEAATEDLPWMIGEGDQVQQNGAQPCYLQQGTPPQDPATPCSDEQQQQPKFNGRQSFYNSGFIPYQGPQGNRFEVPLANDIPPGTYNYYCNLHGPGMAGTITVVPSHVEIPSQEEVARQARQEIDAMAAPLEVAHRQAQERDELELGGERYRRPLAGWSSPSVNHAFISEFYPEPLEVRTGEKVTWNFIGFHTVSFNVPRYFASITVQDDGTVVLNPQAVEPVNSPPLPEEPEEGPPPEHGEAQAPEAPKERPPPPVVDAGEWDGTGFKSSGGFFEGGYSLTFTRPGTYNYACLLHPRMVGKVTVR